MLSRVVLRSLVQRPIPASQLAGCTLLFNKSFSSKKDKKEAPKPPSNTPAPAQVNASSQSKTSFPNAESLLDELKEAILKKKTNSYSTFFASKLFEFAKQNNQTDKLITEFEQLVKNIEENPEIANLVKYSTVIPKEQYISLQNLLKEKKTPDYFLSIIASLYKLHKLRILSKILDTIRVYQDQALGIIRGELLSAEEFSPKKLNQLIEEIKEQVDAKQVILKTRVDSNLISGFVLNTPQLKVDTSESGLIASALAEKLNREEQQLRKLTRAWESGFANYVAPKPDEAHKLVNVPETADVFDTPIKNRKNVYDFYGLLQRNPDAQEEYRSFAPVDDPDLFLRDAFEQLRYRQEGKKIYAENQARRAYFESLQWDPEIPDDLTVPYFTEIKANK